MDRARLEKIAKLSDSSNHEAFEIGDLWNAIDELLDYVDHLENVVEACKKLLFNK